MIKKNIGIISYGTALPLQALKATQIEAAQGKSQSGIPQSLGIVQKTVPAQDEDTITLATAAGAESLSRCRAARSQIGSLFVGSESHPYAVKPSGTVVQSALGLPELMAMADLQFACKAGTQALQICYSYVKAGLIEAGMAIGADTAQSRPGDVLEFSAGAGAAACVVGSDAVAPVLAQLRATVSVASDTPDFWRRPGQPYPEHAGRFTGEPAYFTHVMKSAQVLLSHLDVTPNQIDYCIFHTPNGKFPRAVAKKLGFTADQLEPSLVVDRIGNTYAAAAMLAFSHVLDQASANKKILLVSYGSGSGSDAFLFETTPALVTFRSNIQQTLSSKIQQLSEITYTQYAQRSSNH